MSGVGLTAELCKSQKERTMSKEEKKNTKIDVNSQVAKQKEGDRPLRFGHEDKSLGHKDFGAGKDLGVVGSHLLPHRRCSHKHR